MKERNLGPAGAWAVAWTVVAVVNQVAIALLRRPRTGLRERWLHHAFDLGQIVAIIAVGALVALLWTRRPSSSSWRGLLAFGLFSIVAGVLALEPDFTGFSERLGQPWLRWPLAAAASLALPAARVAGSVARRPWLRAATAVPVAAAAAFVNHRILAADYPGMHLLLVGTGATYAAAALVGARLPTGLDAILARIPRALRLAVPALAVTGAVATVGIWPPSRVLVEIWKTDGTVLMPFLSRLRGTEIDAEAATTSTTIPERWRQRERPEVPRSTPPGLVPTKPLLVLVTLDAVRGEVLTDPVSQRRLPHLAKLAREGVHFRVARAPGASTRNSLSAVFSGKYNGQLRWAKKKGLGRHLLDDDTPRLPDLLRAGGFKTVHLTSYSAVLQNTRALGTFDEERLLKPAVKGQRFALAEQMLDAGLEVIDAAGKEPLFLYMHWMDAHDPYDSAGSDGSDRERWFREVEALDVQIGRLRAELTKRKLDPRTVLVVAADHGEALGEHGIPHHGRTLYESLVRVPLVIHFPGVGRRAVDAPVTLMDLGPTLLDLAGLPTPGHFMGQSLVPHARGEDPLLDRPIAGDAGLVRSLVLGKYKVMEDRRKRAVEIYDLETDPNEEVNLAGTLGELETQLTSELRGFFKAIAETAVDVDDVPND